MDDVWEVGFESYDDFLQHYGVGHKDGGHSGRYPWGSGNNGYQHVDGTGFFANKFLARYNDLKKSGMSDKEIFRQMGLYEVKPDGTIKDLGSQRIRAIKAIANDEIRRQQVERAKKLYSELGNYSAVAREMGFINSQGKPQDTTVRKLLDDDIERRMNVAKNAAEVLKKEVDKKGFIDVGTGVERGDKLGISSTMKDQALELLKMEGYLVQNLKVPQATNERQDTTVSVLFKDDPNLTEKETWKKLFNALGEGKIYSVDDYYSTDGGQTFQKWHYPESLDSSRLKIKYDEQGGSKYDGLVELRPGVEDISLGDAVYSQVRIMVDGKSYIKGVACYGDPKDFPPGCDVIFNTNKKEGTPVEKVLKDLKGVKSDQPIGPDNPIDVNNPFGSAIKEGPKGQRWYEDPKTGEQKLSLINKRADEGDWANWDDSKIPSQFGSKQDAAFIKRQLDLSLALARAEYKDICSLSNPTIKKYYLDKFADECDTAARDLSAAALPRQKYQLLIPANSLKDNEVYAPNYRNGETLALIRFPHGGTFEIAICKVNNKNKESIKRIGRNATDAVCINAHVASRLSGADFDGDTVLAIPLSSKVHISSREQLSSLEGFDPKASYGTKEVDGHYVNALTGARCKLMPKGSIQKEMGVVSNLITDMTLRNAPFESPDGVDIAHAVRHSMVVIDAYKHKLDYKASEVDNHIGEMKARWQSHYDLDGKWKEGGASTIISRADAEARIPERYGERQINKDTGEVWYKQRENATYRQYVRDKSTGKVVLDKDGNPKFKEVPKQSVVSQMDVVKDARQLVSPDYSPKELLYADYANARKAMANEARKEMMATKERQYSASAKEAYRNEVASLNVKLNDALKNAPRERRAQIMAYSAINQVKLDNPGMTKEEKRKVSQKAITSARGEVGSVKRSDRNIDITDREWDAIQAGAFPSTNLRKILDNTDPDKLRARAMPKSTTGLTDGQIAKIKALASSGNWTNEEIASKLGVSASTVAKYKK